MNILVADGSELIRSRLAERLGNVPGVATVVTADSIRQTLRSVSSGLFGLAILDLHLPDGTSSPIVAAIKQASTQMRVVIFSNDADEVNRRLCMKAGADWFFDKSLELEQILQLAASLAAPQLGAVDELLNFSLPKPSDSRRSERNEV